MFILWFTLEVHEIISLLDVTFHVPPLKWLDNRKGTAKVGVKHLSINQYKYCMIWYWIWLLINLLSDCLIGKGHDIYIDWLIGA
jgi:hypothetical protein